MIKKILTYAGITAVIGALIFGAYYRTTAMEGKEYSAERQGLGQGRGTSENSPSADYEAQAPLANSESFSEGSEDFGDASLARPLPPASDEISSDESAALLFMREEEKLAHDVYLALYERWGLSIFQNIAQSELAHTNSVKTLLDRYGIDDPASPEEGVFANPELQKLYTELVQQGSISLVEAIKVGTAIEEIDILDLQERLAASQSADIQQVFNNLLRGSYNHLRAFANQLQRQNGEVYQPQYLSQESYQSILSGTGNGRYGGGSNGGTNRGGKGRGGSF